MKLDEVQFLQETLLKQTNLFNCLICNVNVQYKSVNGLITHIKRNHNISYVSYRKQFGIIKQQTQGQITRNLNSKIRKQKINELKNANYQIVVVWEKDWKDDKECQLQRIKDAYDRIQ